MDQRGDTDWGLIGEGVSASERCVRACACLCACVCVACTIGTGAKSMWSCWSVWWMLLHKVDFGGGGGWCCQSLFTNNFPCSLEETTGGNQPVLVTRAEDTHTRTHKYVYINLFFFHLHLADLTSTSADVLHQAEISKGTWTLKWILQNFGLNVKC